MGQAWASLFTCLKNDKAVVKHALHKSEISRGPALSAVVQNYTPVKKLCVVVQHERYKFAEPNKYALY